MAAARFFRPINITTSPTTARMKEKMRTMAPGMMPNIASSQLVRPSVRAGPAACHRDEAQHLGGDGAHRGDGLDLMVGDARVVDDGLRDDLVRVADEDGARLAVAL